jgi:hypothetical protein
MFGLKILFALYGVSVSAVSAYGLFKIDLPALEYAVQVRSVTAEQRHRLNVAAEGNWILLGNLITVCSLCGLGRPCIKDDQA